MPPSRPDLDYGLSVTKPDDPTAKARAVRLAQTAHRAAHDPTELARAVRIVRAALARQRVTLADLTPLADPTGARP